MVSVERFRRERREWQRFRSLDRNARTIVFYAETAEDYSHFQPMIEVLTGSLEQQVCYLTSDADDPILETGDERVHPFYIGERLVRTLAFMTMRATVMVMTMPSLDAYYIKRSRSEPIHYVYMFHSMVSTHMIYVKGAFDHYDTVFCVGPHHREEIRATEAAYELPAKELVEVGYGRLDSILADNPRPAAPEISRTDRPRVLVAPSWGPRALLESKGERLVQILLDGGFEVRVRPHPMTMKKWPKVIHRLKRRFEQREKFSLETDVGPWGSLRWSDVMISDWSGAALEYAFGLERPVVFVDLDRKVNNPEYEKIPLEPLEVTIRQEIGIVVESTRLEDVPAAVEKLCEEHASYGERIRDARSRWVFNVGTSGRAASQELVRIVKKVAAKNKGNNTE